MRFVEVRTRVRCDNCGRDDWVLVLNPEVNYVEHKCYFCKKKFVVRFELEEEKDGKRESST